MHWIYDICMSFVQMVCTNGYQSASKPRVLKWVCYKLVSERLNIVSESGTVGALQIGIRAKVSTLSLDGPVEQSLD